MLSRHRPQKALQRYYFFTKQTNFFVPLFKISTLQRSFKLGLAKLSVYVLDNRKMLNRINTQ